MKPSTWATGALVAALVVASCGTSSNKSNFNGGGNGSGDGGASSGGDGAPSFGDDGGSGNPGFGDGGHPTPTNPVTIDDCPGPVSAATAMSLQAGGPVDPAMKWLYPYD